MLGLCQVTTKTKKKINFINNIANEIFGKEKY